MGNTNDPGRIAAICSLVLGILSIIFWFFTFTAILSVILGIVGLVLATAAKKAGCNDGIRAGGFVCSLIGLIGGAVIVLACVACAGLIGAAANAFTPIY